MLYEMRVNHHPGPRTVVVSHSFLKPFQNPNFNRTVPPFTSLNGSLLLRPITQFSHQPNAHALVTSHSDPGLLFREKVIYLEKLNVNSSKALRQNPNIRSVPISALKSVEECLSSMGVERSAMGRILDMYPQLLTCDPYFDLYPVFDFLLNEVAIPFPDIRKAVIRCPRLLVCSVDEQLRPTLSFLRNLGFVGPNSINYQTALLLVSSVQGTLTPKIEYLQSMGFSYEEVVNMVIRSPGLLTLSIKNNLMPKFEYFLEEMHGDVAQLKRFPQYFSFSLEKKIKPRHRLLLKNGFTLPLAGMLKGSFGKAVEKYFYASRGKYVEEIISFCGKTLLNVLMGRRKASPNKHNI